MKTTIDLCKELAQEVEKIPTHLLPFDLQMKKQFDQMAKVMNDTVLQIVKAVNEAMPTLEEAFKGLFK